MTGRAAQRNRHGLAQTGFTLLEILVVMALLSVIMLALGASMRTVAQSQERIDARLTAAEDQRVATNLLRTTLERVSVRPVVGTRAAGSSNYLFEPSPRSLAWIGIMPARYGAGGRYFFRLGVENVAGQSGLVLRFLPWTDSSSFPDWSQAEARVLASGITAFAVAYADERTPEAPWLPEWTIIDRLPSRVLLSVQTTTEAWPPFVAALRPLQLPRNGGGGFSIGGSK